MAGVKGKSGGPRPNSGRKAKPRPKAAVIDTDGRDPLKLLLDIAFGNIQVNADQLRAAIAAVQYTHPKVGEGGKKERKQKDAESVQGRFTPAAPPRLVAVGGKPV